MYLGEHIHTCFFFDIITTDLKSSDIFRILFAIRGTGTIVKEANYFILERAKRSTQKFTEYACPV